MQQIAVCHTQLYSPQPKLPFPCRRQVTFHIDLKTEAFSQDFCLTLPYVPYTPPAGTHGNIHPAVRAAHAGKARKARVRKRSPQDVLSPLPSLPPCTQQPGQRAALTRVSHARRRRAAPSTGSLPGQEARRLPPEPRLARPGPAAADRPRAEAVTGGRGRPLSAAGCRPAAPRSPRSATGSGAGPAGLPLRPAAPQPGAV